MYLRPPVPPYNMRIRGAHPCVEVDEAELRVLLGVGQDASNIALRVNADCVNRGIYVSATEETYAQLSKPEPFISLCTTSDVERLRVDSNGVICPTLTVGMFTNLIDNYETPDVFLPPSANALATSFITLSNMIVQHMSSSSSQSQGGTSSSSSSTGGISLIDNYKSTSVSAAPTANALRASYYGLSNLLALRLRNLTTALPGYVYASIASNAAQALPAFQLSNNEWLTSMEGQPRFRFDTDGATSFAANGCNDIPMFRWFYNDLQQDIMMLSSTGDLTTRGGVQISGDASFLQNVNISGDLTVNKFTCMYSNLTVFASEEIQSNLRVEGTMVAESPATFFDSVTAYGQTTLSNAEIKGPAVFYDNVTTYGVTTLSNVATLSSTLSVKGATTFDDTVTTYGIVTLSNAAVLCSNLTVQAPAAFYDSVTTYGIAALSNTVFASSNLVVMGAATFMSDTTVYGSTVLSNSLIASEGFCAYGASAFSNTVSVAGNLYVSGGAAAFDSVSVNGTVALSTMSVSGDATVIGSTVLSNTATVYGAATFSNSVLMSSNLWVQDDTRLSGDVRVDGRIRAFDDVVFASNITVLGSVNATTYSYAYSNVTVYSSERIMSNLVVDGDMSLSNALFYGAVAMSNDTTIYGLTTLSNALNVSSNISAIGDCTFGSDVNVSGSLFVGENALTHDGRNLGINLGPSEIPTCTLHVNGAVYSTEQLFALSDRTVKDDIKPITHALDKLNHINGCTYVRIDEASGARHVGVIAQDVNEAVPEAVQIGRDGKMSVSYGSLVAVTIEGIKELQKMQAMVNTSLHRIVASISTAGKPRCRRRSRIRVLLRPAGSTVNTNAPQIGSTPEAV